MQKVLVCTSDAQFFLFLRHILMSEGFGAILVSHADELCSLDDDRGLSAAILESTPADTDDAVRRIRNRLPSLPMILFARERQPPVWLQTGDLLLRHPFDPPTLIGFLRELRCAPLDASSGTVRGTRLLFADLRMDIASMKVHRAGREVPLTALQFRLLRRLLEKSSAVCDREDLIRHCWAPGMDVEPRTVDIHISHIRRVLTRFGPDIIRTIRGSGYALNPPSDAEPHSC